MNKEEELQVLIAIDVTTVASSNEPFKNELFWNKKKHTHTIELKAGGHLDSGQKNGK